MKFRIYCSKYLWILVSISILLFSASLSFSEDSTSAIKINMARKAYYRGENIPVNITFSNGSSQVLNDVVVTARITDNFSVSAKIKSVPANGSVNQLLRMPTILIKDGEYELKVSADSNAKKIVTSEKIFLGKKPNPETMLVWAWGGNGGEWYRKHGYNSWPGSIWRQKEYANDMGFRKRMDEAIKYEAFPNILPNGGIDARDIDLSKMTDPDSRYIGLSKYYKEHNLEIGNPFHPEVAKQQDERNIKMMEVIKDYPSVRTAFFNSEIGDTMDFNQNKAGLELMNEYLGFTDTKVGEPNFVAPNVIADDDKGYQLHKYIYKYGKGVQAANKRAADMVHRYRPDILTMTDPYRSTALLDMFEGIDVVGTWTYTNQDPKQMLYIETMRAVCKPTNQIPLNVVTTLNYPGEIAPTDKWMLMGPGRMTVSTWINLSRAPKIIGNYYGSGTGDPAIDTFQSPVKTTLAFKEISDNVIVPYGPMLTNLDIAPRKIAVLSSAVSRLYGKSPNLPFGYGNKQIYHFFTLLAMAHLQSDVVLDETIERYGLDEYDVLVLPKCDVLTQNVYNKILDFKKRGGIIISDQYLGPQIPDVIKFDFDFTYRNKVTANAITNNKIYAEWDDHIDPKNTVFKEVKGITAMDDQKIMESYAKILKDGLKGIVDPEVDCDQPTVLFNMLEKDGVKYLFVINDKRSYDDWVGKYKAVMEKMEPQQTTVRLNKWDDSNLVAYDVLERKIIPLKKVGDTYQFDLSLSELGGKIIAFYPRKISKLGIDFPKNIAQGNVYPMLVSFKDTSGAFVSGLQPVQLTVADPKGEVSSISDYYCAKTGKLSLDFAAAINDLPGKWKVTAIDLTSGLKAEQYFTMVKK